VKCKREKPKKIIARASSGTLADAMSVLEQYAKARRDLEVQFENMIQTAGVNVSAVLTPTLPAPRVWAFVWEDYLPGVYDELLTEQARRKTE